MFRLSRYGGSLRTQFHFAADVMLCDNETPSADSVDVVYLEVGDTTAGDSVTGPDDDIQAVQASGSWQFAHEDGAPCSCANPPAITHRSSCARQMLDLISRKGNEPWNGNRVGSR